MADYLAPLLIISGFVIFVMVGWYVTTFNKFIKYKNRIEASWSNIDVALKRRANLIPNMIELVKGYEEHETDTLSTISKRFSEKEGLADRLQEESRLSRSFGGLLAVAEAYPDLKASSNFLHLQNSLNEIEEEIQRTRNMYNGAVGRFNTLVESFPSLYIARRFNFEKMKYFSLELATQGQMPGVSFTKMQK